jgi:flagellar motor protein MotB
VSVVKFIVEKAGLDASRLVPVGKGPTEPLSNLDPRDAKNRRVVFKVVG